jgi:predicted nucleic acid-binding Zn ribbon protein
MSQSDVEKSGERLPDRQCENCHGEVGMEDKMCSRCGFALNPVRSTKAKWRGISFPVFVFWVSIFCVLMILWLPR